jgi:putative SOS response-associated peptidase YedK
MCNLCSITTNQAAIIALFRVMNRYVGNLPPMPGVFPDYPARVVRTADGDRELTMMPWRMPPPPTFGGPPGGISISSINPVGKCAVRRQIVTWAAAKLPH